MKFKEKNSFEIRKLRMKFFIFFSNKNELKIKTRLRFCCAGVEQLQAFVSILQRRPVVEAVVLCVVVQTATCHSNMLRYLANQRSSGRGYRGDCCPRRAA